MGAATLLTIHFPLNPFIKVIRSSEKTNPSVGCEALHITVGSCDKV